MVYLALAVLTSIILFSFASLRGDRGDAVGIPLVALGTFALLYVLQPIRLIATGSMDLYLTDWEASKAILIAAVMLTFFMGGWLSGRQRNSTRTQPGAWNRPLLWTIGAWAATIGTLLHLVFLELSGGIAYSFSKPHGAAMAWQDNSAYLYDSLWWVLSGAVMMVVGSTPSVSNKWKRRLPLAFALVFVVYAVLTGGRGPLFSTVGALFVAVTLARGQIVSMKKAVGLLTMVACGISVVLGFRSVLHLGERDAVAIPTLAAAVTSLTDVSDWNQAHGTTGLEFLYHAAAIDTVDQTGRLDYGLSWLYFLAINPIPRLLWPEKHYPESPGISVDDIRSCTGIPIAVGAASGLVADLYIRFGYGSVIVMFGLGRLLKKTHSLALRLQSPVAVCTYVMLYSLSLNLFAQDVRAILVAFLYSMFPVLLYSALCSVHDIRDDRNPFSGHRGLLEGNSTMSPHPG